MVAHRAFHLQKRPAQRAVVVSRRRHSAEGMVAIQAVLRFLRFQAPCAYGRNVFALLRRAPAERWVNRRYRLMDVVETWCVRVIFGNSQSERRRVTSCEEQIFLRGRWSMDVLLSRGGNGVRQGLYKHLAECLLTNVWC